MKKFFVYSLILSVFVFTHCRKSSNKPKNNTLVVLYPDGNTISTGLPYSSIDGGSIDAFYIEAYGRRKCNLSSLQSSNFDFDFKVTQGIPPTIIFNSSGTNQGIKMQISDSDSITWIATKGTAHVELSYTDPQLCPQFGKVTFNNVAFTNPIRQDTLWVSAIVNAYYDY